MNHHSTHAALSRTEDHRLLTGAGQFVHDMDAPGLLHVAFVRSDHAHAGILGLDTAAALDVPDVLRVITGHDLPVVSVPAPNALVPGIASNTAPLLPTEELLYVGQPVALVIARTPQAAQRGAAAVWVDCEPLPAWTDHHPDAPTVAELAYLQGEAPGEHLERVTAAQDQPRLVALALEPRAMLARWDAQAGTLQAWLPTQTPWRARADLARLLGLSTAQVRVVAPDVGGAFGARSSLGPEELVIAWAARAQACSLRWVATRSEEFTAGMHGRAMGLEGTLALDADGRMRHLHARIDASSGAWLPFSAAAPVRNAARILPGPYRLDGVDIAARLRLAHAAPVTIYRGAGRPEAALLMERLVERAARCLGIDPLELRRRNLIDAGHMPWRTPTGETLDAGDYRAALDQAADRFGYAAERAAQAHRRAAGEVVGIGCALYIEPCGQGWESARVTLQADGTVEVASGSSAQGQGHETSYAAIAAQALGCEAGLVRVRHGDTAHGPEGIGALASRSMAIGGSAVLLAAQAAARQRDAGAPLPISVTEVYHAPAEAWSYGCVLVRLAIDRETGRPQIERLLWIDDAGHIVSSQLARGQLLGGLAQGLGQALLERIVYDGDGQLLTGSLMDYAAPRADDVPVAELHALHRPTSANALGAKGVGEAGCIGVPAAILNAAADALAPFGDPDLDFPLTAERLWRAMQPDQPSH